jgi:hypothetical protein
VNNLEAAHRHWAELITEAWQKSVVAIIETGSLLAEAKAALPHGKFLQMVERDLPFEARTAQMLMAIAANPWIANHGTHLPASWRTLYELSRVEPALLDEALRSGAIKPDMKRREIKRLTAIGRFSFFIFNIDWRQQRMTEQEIAAFDLPSIATDDCMVLIHAETSEGSKRAAALLREWGFANAFSYRLTTENDPELRREVRSGCYDIQRNGPLPQHWAGAFRGDAGHDSVLWDLSCWLSLPKEMDKVRGRV